MFHLGVPAIDQHELTRQLLDSLAATVSQPGQLHVIVIDNGSSRPYRAKDLGQQPFKVSLHKVVKRTLLEDEAVTAIGRAEAAKAAQEPQPVVGKLQQEAIEAVDRDSASKRPRTVAATRGLEKESVAAKLQRESEEAEVLLEAERAQEVQQTVNLGYYRSILEVAKWAGSADLIGLAHNDLIFYEVGWDLRLRQEFLDRSIVGMIGFSGSSEIDASGGTGGRAVSGFRGERGPRPGRRITQLQYALTLDSTFLAMRQPILDSLQVDEHTPLYHFVDRLWSLRTLRAGWQVAVLPVELDHLGGQTAALAPRCPEDARQWCLQESVDPGVDPGLALYLEAEKRFLAEARSLGRLPAKL